MTYKKINEHVYIFKDEGFYDVNAGAIEFPEMLVFIDSGVHLRKMKEFKEYVEKETGKRAQYLILSHYHGDHYYGNQLFSDIKIIAHKHVLDMMNDYKERWTEEKIAEHVETIEDRTQMEGLVITPPNTILEDSMEIEQGDVKVIIKNTGGHTICSSYVYCPTYDVVFGGDLIFESSVPYGGDKTSDPNLWIDAYKEMMDLDVTYYIPGHGNVTDKAYLQKSIDFILMLKNKMTKMKKDGNNQEEIEEQIFQDHFSSPEDTEHDINLKKGTTKQWYSKWFA